MSKTKNQILLMDLLGNPVAILAHNKENKFQHVITNGIWAEPVPFEANICLDDSGESKILHVGRILDKTYRNRKDYNLRS